MSRHSDRRPSTLPRTFAAILVAFVLLVLGLAACADQEVSEPDTWEALPSPFSGQINELLVTVGAQGEIIQAATEGGVFRSADEGRTWTPHLDGLDNRLVRSLAANPDWQQILYAGTWGGRIYATSTESETWQDIGQGIDGYDIVSVAVDSEDPLVIHVATTEGVYTTLNGGQTWDLSSLPPQAPITCLALDSLNSSVVYVGTWDGLVYYSTDRTANWAPPVLVAQGLSALVPVPGESGGLYAIAAGKVYRGHDFGQRWAYNDNYLDKAQAQCLAVDPGNAKLVLVGTTQGVYRSEDARATWASSNSGLEEGRVAVSALAYSVLEPGVVYAASANWVYRSENGGKSWRVAGKIEDGLTANILALAPQPGNAGWLVASAAGGGAYATRDGGRAWRLIEGLPSAWVTSLNVPEREPDTVYAGTLEGIPYRSTDQGETWSPSSFGLSQKAIMDIVAAPEEPSQLYLGTWGDGLYGTQNWESGWQKLGLDAKLVRKIVVDSRAALLSIYVLAEDATYLGTYQQAAGAPNQLTLTRYLGPVAALLPTSAPGTIRVVVAGSESPELSKEQAAHPEVYFVSGVAPQADIELLQADPIDPAVIYLAVKGSGVLRSENQGQTWASLAAGLEGRAVQALAIHPTTRNMYAGTDLGVFLLPSQTR